MTQDETVRLLAHEFRYLERAYLDILKLPLTPSQRAYVEQGLANAAEMLSALDDRLA